MFFCLRRRRCVKFSALGGLIVVTFLVVHNLVLPHSGLDKYIGHNRDQTTDGSNSPLEEEHYDISKFSTPHSVSYRQTTTPRTIISRNQPKESQNDASGNSTSQSSGKQNSSLSQRKDMKLSLKQQHIQSIQTLQVHKDVTSKRTHSNVLNTPQLHGEPKRVSTKLILWHMIPHYRKYVPDYNITCKHQAPCVMTNNRSRMAEADVIVVDSFLLSRNRVKDKPVRTSPNQAFVFFSRERWHGYSSLFPKSWDGVFNWTLTYQRNSDIHIPYGEVMLKGKAQKNPDWSAIMKKKTQSVFWLVSNCNCNSKRMVYVDELRKHIDVHIVGNCGVRTCDLTVSDREKDDTKPCFEKSRFYLAFENAFCQDYVTEKFYKTFKYHIIPIVRGKANYSKICPSDLFIDTADYNSPKELAGYLKYLNQNETAYLGYLKRRAQYRVGGGSFKTCQVCSFAHNLDKHRRSYPSITSWIDSCDVPKQPHLH